MYRSTSSGPYLRSSLARTVYERIQMDEELRNIDKTSWYCCDLNLINDDQLKSSFFLMNADEETEAFLDRCYEKSDWLFTQLWHSIVRSILGWFMTQTSINSWLQRGSMFVFSSLQFRNLLDFPEDWKGSTLLDLGAGDGNVTSIMAPFFEAVHTTEASSGMRSLLAKKGYKVLEIDKWDQSETRYDVIAFLNLLDRCEKPLSMLRSAKEILIPETGRILVALALPFSPYVEFDSVTHKPSEEIHVCSDSFEGQVADVVQSVFRPLGLEVVKWSKCPYLCEGDLHQSYYWLQDALFVLKSVA